MCWCYNVNKLAQCLIRKTNSQIRLDKQILESVVARWKNVAHNPTNHGFNTTNKDIILHD